MKSKNENCHNLANILQIWMIPHIHTLFEFISIPYENQHQTLNIKKLTGAKSGFESIQLRYRNLKRKYALPIFFFLRIMIPEDFPNETVYDSMHLYRHFTIHDIPKKFALPEILTWNAIFWTNYVMCKYLCNNQIFFICRFTANQVISSYAISSKFFKNIGFLWSFDIFGVTGSVGRVS